MVSHVVLMKPRADLSTAERDGLLQVFERATRDIPTIRGVRIGRFNQSLQSGMVYDFEMDEDLSVAQGF